MWWPFAASCYSIFPLLTLYKFFFCPTAHRCVLKQVVLPDEHERSKKWVGLINMVRQAEPRGSTPCDPITHLRLTSQTATIFRPASVPLCVSCLHRGLRRVVAELIKPWKNRQTTITHTHTHTHWGLLFCTAALPQWLVSQSLMSLTEKDPECHWDAIHPLRGCMSSVCLVQKDHFSSLVFAINM